MINFNKFKNYLRVHFPPGAIQIQDKEFNPGVSSILSVGPPVFQLRNGMGRLLKATPGAILFLLQILLKIFFLLQMHRWNDKKNAATQKEDKKYKN